jgi:hypothetical protein
MTVGRKLITGVLAASFALTITAAGTTAAGAGVNCDGSASNTPDGRIRANGAPYEGVGTFGTEYVDVQLADGETATFDARWKNLTGVFADMRVFLNSPQQEDIGVRFTVKGTNVSKKFRQKGVLRYPGVPAGRSAKIQYTVKNKSGGDVAFPFGVVALEGRYKGSNDLRCDLMFARIND